jgi:hypothetical protein
MIELMLNADEVRVLLGLLGSVAGTGPEREAADALYGRIYEAEMVAQGPVVD